MGFRLRSQRRRKERKPRFSMRAISRSGERGLIRLRPAEPFYIGNPTIQDYWVSNNPRR
jgi:hypothetical protein